MKSRYVFNASGGSVLVTPTEYVLEARRGSLRLVRPSGAVFLIQLAVILAVVFGYLGAFAILVSSSIYQAARPWQNPMLTWIILGSFFIGFFALLFATVRWAAGFAMTSAGRFSSRVDRVILRGLEAGKLIQNVLLLTADNRILELEVEGTINQFQDALRLAKVTLPPVPLTEAELSSIESARQQVARAYPEPVGPRRVNVPGFALLSFFILLNILYLWFLSRGETVLGILGLIVFGPLTIWLAWYFSTRTGRLRCGVCERITVFRRQGESWTCVQCGGTWPPSLGKPDLEK